MALETEVPTENPIIVDRFDPNITISLSLAGIESWAGPHKKGAVVHVNEDVRGLAIMVLEMMGCKILQNED